MVKRTSYLRFFYMAFALILLISCWEAQRNNAVVFASNVTQTAGAEANASIPQESIRLRILANSDSPSDQWVKREVRDAIVEQMSQWVQGPHTIEQARETVRAHLPELHKLVGDTLRKYGFTYDYQVELGTVPFPMKMYGNQIYPAGEYEALRVSIGEAEGQNWWCVLFPPLCFVDSDAIAKPTNVAEAAAANEDSAKKTEASSANGDASKPSKTAGKSQSSEKTPDKAVKGTDSSKAGASTASANVKLAAAGQPSVSAAAQAKAPQPEIHFFLWDLLKKLGSLFA
ncbi:stage II sporulation protein R [Paenibacillus rigui]|uniref:Stage II sporulation protein R n=1 Tax=Paenibacillus rigui TaxID=554312 RepID=A0A229USW1_9BACL|nr:stage II sporulation protein R [Paenibacillus rigui]OXM86423.1 stage II sporulation protein R [Paenibacillus rigui]